MNLRLDDVVDEIHQEGTRTRTGISREVKKEGELTRKVIQQATGASGKLLSLLLSCSCNSLNVIYQKSASAMPQTLDSIRTQGAWNA